jgi:hypothetical protein
MGTVVKCLMNPNTLLDLCDTRPVAVLPVTEMVVQDLQFCVLFGHFNLQVMYGVSHVISLVGPEAYASVP